LNEVDLWIGTEERRGLSLRFEKWVRKRQELLKEKKQKTESESSPD